MNALLPSPPADDVLLVIDVQNDFCANSTLALPEGDQVAAPINRLASRFRHVVLTQDWHPRDHLSFASNHPGWQPYDTIRMANGDQTLWPEHCVQGSYGASLHADRDTPHAELVLRKGNDSAIDSYSALFENDRSTRTGLSGYLNDRGMRRFFLVGLATDHCVFYSALDGRREGFEVVVILAACRRININRSLATALTTMRNAGVDVRNCPDA